MSKAYKILHGKDQVSKLQRGMAAAIKQGDKEQYDHLARHEQEAREAVNAAIRTRSAR